MTILNAHVHAHDDMWPDIIQPLDAKVALEERPPRRISAGRPGPFSNSNVGMPVRS
jgi:hypothetical protein